MEQYSCTLSPVDECVAITDGIRDLSKVTSENAAVPRRSRAAWARHSACFSITTGRVALGSRPFCGGSGSLIGIRRFILEWRIDVPVPLEPTKFGEARPQPSKAEVTWSITASTALCSCGMSDMYSSKALISSPRRDMPSTSRVVVWSNHGHWISCFPPSAISGENFFFRWVRRGLGWSLGLMVLVGESIWSRKFSRIWVCLGSVRIPEAVCWDAAGERDGGDGREGLGDFASRLIRLWKACGVRYLSRFCFCFCSFGLDCGGSSVLGSRESTGT